MKILVVEYVIEIREYLVDLLKKEGFVVDATDSAKEGLGLACQNKYQTIVTNAWSSDMSGLVMIRKLRDEDIECPILMHTARCRWQDTVAAYMAGADDYMSMPSRPDEFLSRLRDLSSGKEPKMTDEILVAREKFLKSNGAVRFSFNEEFFTKDEREWSPQEVEQEWVAQEEKRLARRERKLKALSFLYP